jgi:hypothetical protein
MESGTQDAGGRSLAGRRTPAVRKFSEFGRVAQMQVEAGRAYVLDHDFVHSTPGPSRQELPATSLERTPLRFDTHAQRALCAFRTTQVARRSFGDEFHNPRKRRFDLQALACRVEEPTHQGTAATG